MPLGLDVHHRVRDLLDENGDVEVLVTKTQVTYRTPRRGFAVLWRPGVHLDRPPVDLVLSVLLDRPIASSRWRQVVQLSPNRWQHHLAVTGLADVDEEVADWLREAQEAAV
ncbi:DUF5655 domain-containing protein [Egicoccus sp. AB-alg2]|uniref:DUF5655 domain-containing protein n=1 Tax=Egicoccus sp. AB-alg2 TaxID=3242693 RepID=UPI00359E44F9